MHLLMPKHTLQELFGANAAQTATTITIAKADLPTLTASANNTGSQILTAIAIKAKDVATQAVYDADTDKSIYVGSGFDSLSTRGNTASRTTQIVINMTKPDTAATLDADDY